jgi:3-hydroxy-3-methylglutaryl CoA synthase
LLEDPGEAVAVDIDDFARSRRARLHFSAGGVAMVVTITMIITAEKMPSSTTC